MKTLDELQMPKFQAGQICICLVRRQDLVGLSMKMGFISVAAPAKRSHCSLPWTRGISSLPPFLTFNVG